MIQPSAAAESGPRGLVAQLPQSRPIYLSALIPLPWCIPRANIYGINMYLTPSYMAERGRRVAWRVDIILRALLDL